MLRAVDDAWNDRRWDDYAALLHPDLQAVANDSPVPHGCQRHVQRAREFCALYPDARVHEPYLEVFGSADGNMTCTVSRVTGRPVGAAAGFDITMAIIAAWVDGRMIGQRQFLDEQRMARQVLAAKAASR
ncbi:MAG: hypothetical protein DI605_18195 [Sphingomonas sp.]|nr:MAG: hypothetical protein DI605_18195 [Sphingomonas sp.]